ncbi:hypothetical protein ACE400_29075, partial [Salmonella enterica]|uniref:hypothetical protein n=1 Tax=Salmonella enterica TaxID=28901 RepID=UPI003D26C6FE
RLTERTVIDWNGEERRIEARRERRLGAIVLARVPDPVPDGAAVVARLLTVVRDGGLDLLPLSPASRALVSRGRHAGLAALDPAHLLATAEEWL